MKSWTSKMSLEQTLRLLEDLSARLLEPFMYRDEAGCLLRYIREGDLKSLLSFQVDYSRFVRSDAEYVRCLRQVLGFYQKSDAIDIGIDLESVAYEKFLEAEKSCAATNLFFLSLRGQGLCLAPSFASVLHGAQKKIKEILGKVPRLCDLGFRFGPGATSTVRRSGCSLQKKLADAPSCSENLLRSPLLPSFLREIPHWLEAHETTSYIEDGYEVGVLDVLPASAKLTFVAKNALSHRSIMTQPTLNSFFQLGIGDYMVKRLKRAGVDLSDQSVNQRWARKGSLEGGCPGSIATLDLQSASDTISFELVKFLLPEDWFAILNATRCPTFTYRDYPAQRLQHFSSMGNGFTFPLESLIFYALCASVAQHPDRLSVYGDDIVVAVEDYDRVRYALETCGFLVNAKKSFASGFFRESCGADYFYGFDIRPYYQRTLISPESLFSYHNFLWRRWYREEACYIASLIPVPLRRWGPDGYGDGHLLSEAWPSFVTRQSRRRGWGGVFFRTYKHVGQSHPSLYPGDWVSPLYTIYMRERVPERDTQVLRFLRDGRPLYDVPDSCGYEEVSIYTF